MSDNFKALVLNQEGDNFTREIKSVNKEFLKHGDVLVKVEYSGLNYKDALILKNGARLVKEFPHILGVDFYGTVAEADSSNFKEVGDIICTGMRVADALYGAFSHYANIESHFIIKKPKLISTRRAIVLGTAGFPALQCSFTTKQTKEI